MRELNIKKIQRKLQQLSASLVKQYDAKVLKQFTNLEKELEIQRAYEQHESK